MTHNQDVLTKPNDNESPESNGFVPIADLLSALRPKLDLTTDSTDRQGSGPSARCDS